MSSIETLIAATQPQPGDLIVVVNPPASFRASDSIGEGGTRAVKVRAMEAQTIATVAVSSIPEFLDNPEYEQDATIVIEVVNGAASVWKHRRADPRAFLSTLLD